MSPNQQPLLPFARQIPFHNTRFRSLFSATKLLTAALPIIPVSLIWLLMIYLANPLGEFPLNDDWSYGRAVQSLVEHGHLQLTGFTSMPLIAQVFWGALFCLPFGFSFSALRASTITLGLLGILTTYWIFEELGIERKFALFAMVVVAINPLYFQLSLTFMTDVPFFAFSMFAFLFFLRALRTESLRHIIAGYVFSFIAILIRQPAIVIPLSFLVTYFFKNRICLKTLVNALIPNGFFICWLFAFPIVLRWTIGLPALYNRSYEPIVESAPLGWLQIPMVFADRMLVGLLYLGLFLLPFLIGLETIKNEVSHLQTRQLPLFAWTVFVGAISAYLIWRHRIMPLSGNLFFDLGLGPLSLRDTYLLRLPHWHTAPKAFWIIVTVGAALGGVLLFRRLSSTAIKIFKELTSTLKVEDNRVLFLLSAIVLYSTLIGIAGFLDRYLIWLSPLLMGVVSIPINSLRLHVSTLPLVIVVALIFLYALFALAGTHDYMAWNRARWQALTDLMEKDHISYRNIDGGFEFNGWYSYNATFHPDSSKSWWWVEDDGYAISFGPIAGYTEIKQYTFHRWIPFGQGDIFVLKRVEESISGEPLVK